LSYLQPYESRGNSRKMTGSPEQPRSIYPPRFPDDIPPPPPPEPTSPQPDPDVTPEDQEEEAGASKRSRKKDVRCEVCGLWFRSLSARHLRTHGLTRVRYRRLFVGVKDPTLTGSTDQSTQQPLTTVAKLADRITGSPAFLDAISAEVADHILNAAPLRSQVAFAAAQVIQARMAIHADAVGRLARISEELDADWRTQQGGPGGTPTPTRDLLGMAAQAHAEIAKAEDMVLKAAKLALEEQKAQSEQRAPSFTYSGEAESIPIPRDLGPADREALRALMGNLTRYVDHTRTARKAITVAAEEAVKDVSLPSVSSAGETGSVDQSSSGAPDQSGVSLPSPKVTKRRRRRKKPSTDAPPQGSQPTGSPDQGEGGVSDLGVGLQDGGSPGPQAQPPAQPPKTDDR
jgi:hypothetical protein